MYRNLANQTSWMDQCILSPRLLKLRQGFPNRLQVGILRGMCSRPSRHHLPLRHTHPPGLAPNSWKSSSKWPSQASHSFMRERYTQSRNFRIDMYWNHFFSVGIDAKPVFFKKVSVNLPLLSDNPWNHEESEKKSNPTTFIDFSTWLCLICNSRWSKCGFSRFAVIGLGESDAPQQSSFHVEIHMEILGGHSSDSVENRDTYCGCYAI